MRMRLIMTRHGQTDWNAEHRLQGQQDTKLNATGLAQARALRDLIAKEELVRAYCSPLTRARRTAQILLEGHKTPLIMDARLAEIRLGRLEGLTMDEARRVAGSGRWDYEAHGAETPKMVRERVETFVKERLTEPGTTLIVTHAMTLKALRLVLLDLPMSALDEVATPSCCYCEAVWRDGCWWVVAFGEELGRLADGW